MTLRLDLTGDELEDALRDEIDRKTDAFRASGAIGDLIRLRDARVHAGMRLADVDAPSVLQKPLLPYPLAGLEYADGVPELDITMMKPEAVYAALDAFGVLILRNVMPSQQTLAFRRMFDAALQAARELRLLTDEDVPDIRHTDSKEMLCAIKAPRNALLNPPGDIAATDDMINTITSPRISFELFDFLTIRGFMQLLQKLMQDHVRFSLDQCIIHRTHSGKSRLRDEKIGPTNPKGLLLWMPLLECGEGTQCGGLDIALPSGSRIGRLDKTPKQAQPYLAGGDAVLIQNKNVVSTSYGPEFTRSNVVIETGFLARSAATPRDNPVFW